MTSVFFFQETESPSTARQWWSPPKQTAEVSPANPDSPPFPITVVLDEATKAQLQAKWAAAAREAVEAGQKALRAGRAPWYDAKADTFAPLTPPAPPEPRDLKLADTNLEGGTRVLAVLFRGLLWLVAAVLLAGLLWYALQFWRGLPALPKPEKAKKTAIPARYDRLEALPVLGTREEFLAEAGRRATAGQYEAAMVYFLSYQLLSLDNAGVIELQKGKTNGRYLREVTLREPSLRAYFATSVRLFEDAFFGKLPVQPAAFAQVWEARAGFSATLSQRLLNQRGI